jgi:GTP-binding protein Era
MGAPQTRCGIVALIGAPNAGKSTLLNRLVGQKVAIVTRKVQTTRAPLRAVAIRGHSQLVFVDTPGIFRAGRRLERAMVAAAWAGARDADMVVLIVDAAAVAGHGAALDIAATLAAERRPMILALNKIDLVEKSSLLALTRRFAERAGLARVFMISAEEGAGVDDLADHLAAEVPAGPWLFPEDQLTDAPLRVLAAEITREKLIEHLHDELPYALSVETESWQDRKDGSVRIAQVIYVERAGQRMIVLGRGGATIKRISIAARAEIGRLLERTVHLFIFVKVRAKWAEDPERYRQIGLTFSSGD